MNANAEDFRRHFELLSDEALLATNRDDLVPIAQDCCDAEIERRGLNATSEAETTVAEPEDPDSEKNEMVVIAAYTSFEEASLARGLLQSAGIECFLGNEHVGMGTFELQLSVAEEFVEPALDVLGSEISDDELAAQAAAAAPVIETEDHEETDEELPE